MPTYTVCTPAGQLTSAQKANIAREVTHTHSKVTGAQTFFAEVVFQEIDAGNWFMGGVPLKGKQVFMTGQVRGGRPPEMMRDLLTGMRDVLAKHAGVANTEVWVYIQTLPPSLMLEYGYILPEPGKESTWLSDMAPEDRAMLEAMGK